MAVNLCPLPKYTHTQRNLFCIKIHKDKDNNDIKKKNWKLYRQMVPYLCVRSVAQPCPTLCDPMNCRLPGSSVHGIFQARIPFPSPGDLPNPGIEPRSSALQMDSLPSEPPGKPSPLLRRLESWHLHPSWSSLLHSAWSGAPERPRNGRCQHL